MRVLVVEDDDTTASTLAVYLRHEGYDVSIAGTGTRALEAVHSERPDLIVLDLMLPEISGLDVCETLRGSSDVPIIMLTARAGEDDKLRGLRLGADDYMTKPFSPRELVARVASVLRRARTIENGRTQFRNLTVDCHARRAYVDGTPIALTPTEFRLLHALSSHPNLALSRAQLVHRVFGFDYSGMDRTLDVHVRNLRRKLADAGATAEFIRTVFGVGYAFDGDPAE